MGSGGIHLDFSKRLADKVFVDLSHYIGEVATKEVIEEMKVKIYKDVAWSVGVNVDELVDEFISTAQIKITLNKDLM